MTGADNQGHAVAQGADTDVYPWGDQVPGDGRCITCGHKIGPGMLMCARHWRMVSARTRSLLNRALLDWNNGRGTLGTLRDLQRRAWEEVGDR